MTDLAARLTARAALTSAPGTLVSAEEVAEVEGIDPAEVERAVPAGLRRGRAPYSAWLRALGYDSTGPITTWVQAAAVLGVSHDTVSRRRREARHTGRPYWTSAEDLREWWRDLQAPRPAPPARRRTPQRVPNDDAPLDPHELLRELRQGG